MIPRTAVRSKRWLASATAGVMLAGAVAWGQHQTTCLDSCLPETTFPHHAAQPHAGQPTASGHPAHAAQAAQRPAPKQGSLFTFLFGSDEQQGRQNASRPPQMMPPPNVRTAAAWHARGQVPPTAMARTQPPPAPAMAPQAPAHAPALATTPAPAPAVPTAPQWGALAERHEIYGANDRAAPTAFVPPAPVDPIAPPTFAPQPAAARPAPQRDQNSPGLFARLFGRKPAQHHQPAWQPGQAAPQALPAVTPAAPGDELVIIPPAPAPADRLQDIPAWAQPAEFPTIAESEPVLRPAPPTSEAPTFPDLAEIVEAEARSEAQDIGERAELADVAGAAEDEDPFQLPTIVPAASSARPAREPERVVRAAAARHPLPQPAEHRDKVQRIAARSGSGLKGFCPVILRDERGLADAHAEFSSAVGSVTYQFSSAEAKAKFDADPAAYVPAAGGRDVVRASEGNRGVEGSLEFSAWFRDRLYLFESVESLRTFVTEPARFSTDE